MQNFYIKKINLIKKNMEVKNWVLKYQKFIGSNNLELQKIFKWLKKSKIQKIPHKKSEDLLTLVDVYILEWVG